MQFTVKMHLTITVDRDLEHYDLEEETFKNEDEIIEALKDQLEDEINGNGYADFIFNESDIEDDEHTITLKKN